MPNCLTLALLCNFTFQYIPSKQACLSKGNVSQHYSRKVQNCTHDFPSMNPSLCCQTELDSKDSIVMYSVMVLLDKRGKVVK